MVVFFTDSLSRLNGMSQFSVYFKKWLCDVYVENILIFDVSTFNYELINNSNQELLINYVYVNGHFSIADRKFRSTELMIYLNRLGYTFGDDCCNVIISHGWQKTRWRFTFYTFYYNIINFKKTLCINNIKKYYNKILFISTKSSSYRHFDFGWALKNNFKYDYFNFANEFMKINSIAEINVKSENFILVIANFDFVKNLLLMARINLFYFITGRKMLEFKLLTNAPYSFRSKIVYSVLKFAKVKIYLDQSLKRDLLTECKYLFIPSYTEYLPLVALEAFAHKKKVLSYFLIEGLSDCHNYHYIKK